MKPNKRRCSNTISFIFKKEDQAPVKMQKSVSLLLLKETTLCFYRAGLYDRGTTVFEERKVVVTAFVYAEIETLVRSSVLYCIYLRKKLLFFDPSLL